MSLVWEQRVVSAEHQSLILITPIILALLGRLFQYVRSSMYFPYNKFTSQSFEEASLQPTDLKLILSSSFSTRNNSLHICHCIGHPVRAIFPKCILTRSSNCFSNLFENVFLFIVSCDIVIISSFSGGRYFQSPLPFSPLLLLPETNK